MTHEVVVAFASDALMEVPLHVATSTVLRHIAPGIVPHFYLSLTGVGAKAVERLKSTLDMTGKPYLLDVLPEIDARRYDGFATLHGALAHYNRLFLPELIEQDRILYIDADTVTHLDVSPLFDLDMSAHTLGAVLEGSVAQAGDGYVYRELGMSPETPVFNSGVILINAERWRQEDMTYQTLELCKRRFKSGDQPALNFIFRNKVLDLGRKYNIKLYPHISSDTTLEGIFHFLGSPKPWDLLANVFNVHTPLYKRELASTTVSGLRYSSYLRLATYARAPHIAGGYYRAAKALGHR